MLAIKKAIIKVYVHSYGLDDLDFRTFGVFKLLNSSTLIIERI